MKYLDLSFHGLRVSLLGVVVGISFASCSKIGVESGSGGRQPYTRAHELRYAAEGDITGLDGFVHRSGYAYLLDELCAAFLIRTDARGNATVPELATIVPTQANGGISTDGKTITWHLRRGVRWSDGAPFSADDVVFSTQQVNNPANDMPDRTGSWDLITKIDEPDKYTVVYHLRKPFAAYAVTFFSTGSYNPVIVPKHLLGRMANLNNDTAYDEKPVGIGPFKFERWKRGDAVTMVQNPLYWRGSPKLKRIIFKIIPDRNTILAQMRTHELDLWVHVSPRFFKQATTSRGIIGSSEDSNWFETVSFNVSRPITGDINVRRALRFAFDRDALIRKVNYGLYDRSESFISRSNPFFVDLPLVPFDLVKANALLDRDGWKRGTDGIRFKDGRRLSLDYAALAGAPDIDTAIELERASWSRIGAEITVRHYPLSLLLASSSDGGIYASGRFDIREGYGSYGPFPDVTGSYGCDYIPPNGANFTRWCDRKADMLMDRLRSTYDFATEKTASDGVARAIVEQVPTIVVDTTKDLSVYNADLKNFRPNATATFDAMMNVDI